MLQLIEISLICTGIHVCFMEGMIFSKLRFDVYKIYLIWHRIKFKKLKSTDYIDQDDYAIIETAIEFISKPIYDCLPCMASIWTILIMREIDIKSIIIVCGMNAIIASILQFFANSKLPE